MAKKPVPHLDAFDLEAAREGQAVRSANEVRVQKASKKPKAGPLNSKALGASFFKHYGYGGYLARGD